nr:hypothetical protein [Stenotrophomonas maltophilia]
MIAAAAPAPAATPWFHSLDWERLLETYGVPLLAAIVVLLVGMWVARRLSNAMPRATARLGVDPMLGNFLRNVVYAASLVIVVVLAIGTLGVQITPLLAVLGTAGCAGVGYMGAAGVINAGLSRTKRDYRSLTSATDCAWCNQSPARSKAASSARI